MTIISIQSENCLITSAKAKIMRSARFVCHAVVYVQDYC